MITLKIDVTKLDKARFFKGEKGTYCDLILIETPNGQYGDYMVKQSVTKEERQARVEMPILGNGKIIQTGGGRKSDPVRSRSPLPPSSPDDDEIPF